MPRPPRLLYAGAWYHVGTRGNRRREIYVDDFDRTRFLSIFARAAGRLQWGVQCYCLMTNHYHLVLTTPRPNLSSGMEYLNGLYARRFNERHALTGHVFERRFWSEIIEDEEQLGDVVRYVAMNPVRARLVDHPGEWPWTSFRGAGRDFAFDR